jgi:putative ABC transport system substrate-binding protein
MRRHRAVAVIAASLILFASQAGGQQPVHRIGVLMLAENPENQQAFVEGLRARSYVAGQNLQIDYRYSQAQTEQIPTLVAELVAFTPEVIVAQAPQNTVAVHTAAPTIPLIFVAVADPVALGLIETLAHPGGNVTGFATLVSEAFVGKQLQFLKDVIPQASRIAVLINPVNPIHQRERARLPEFGRLLGVDLVVVEASTPEQLETAFETAHARGVEAIHVLGDPLILIHSEKVVGLAARYRLPAMYFNPRNVRDGGLMSYSPNIVDYWYRAGAYVGRILNGEKPGDLPVEQPTRFDLTVNLKTAAELGITVPPSILAQADEVIE